MYVIGELDTQTQLAAFAALWETGMKEVSMLSIAVGCDHFSLHFANPKVVASAREPTSACDEPRFGGQRRRTVAIFRQL